MRFTYSPLTLQLRNPFRLSYGTSETRPAWWIRLADDSGWGETAIPPYYGISDASMMALWEQLAQSNQPFPEEIDEVAAWVGADGPAPARCGVELALYDRIARKHNLPLYALLGLPKPQPKQTCFTIAIDTPESMARLALEVPDYGTIKIKLGSDDDESRLAAIRAARPDARLRVDANAGWSLPEALRLVERLEGFDLEMIEQPLAKSEIEGLGEVQRHTLIPIVADESVQTLADVERLAKAGVAGINLKLQKIGGLTPALQILQRARELGLRVMLGCMIETSIGATAMAHLSGLAEWVDLDSPMLISNDPFCGITYDPHAFITVPERPGIGVHLKDAQGEAHD